MFYFILYIAIHTHIRIYSDNPLAAAYTPANRDCLRPDFGLRIYGTSVRGWLATSHTSIILVCIARICYRHTGDNVD